MPVSAKLEKDSTAEAEAPRGGIPVGEQLDKEDKSAEGYPEVQEISSWPEVAKEEEPAGSGSRGHENLDGNEPVIVS